MIRIRILNFKPGIQLIKHSDKFLLRGFVLLLIFTLCLPGIIFSRDSAPPVLRHNNFLIQYSPQNEKTARAVVQLLEFHCPQLEQFYNFRISETATVLIAASPQAFHAYSQYNLPEWAAAACIASENLILVKSPSWSGSLPRLEKDFLHELSHLYFAHKFKTQNLPLWYNEGLAEYVSGARIEMMQALQMSNALLAGQIADFDAIEQLLHFSQPKAELAYLQCLSAVLYLGEVLNENGGDFQSFNETIVQKGWETALQESIGMDDIAFEVQWYQSLEKKYRWMMLVNIENLLWAFLVMVLFLALFLIRLRNKKKMRRWDAESERFPFDAS